MTWTNTCHCILGLLLVCGLINCREEGRGEASLASVARADEPPSLFTLLSSQSTGVDFQNILEEGPNTNILMYEYFYNGGGVCTGDINGDSLIDIYFTSNMGVNTLYLNKGNMQFEEVSETAGVTGRAGPWKTGATMVDINGDRLLDLYICYSGAMPAEKRANELYINQGNNDQNIPIFKEEARTYGLASQAFSNQGQFFDYDRDGDLDMLLLNHNPKSLPILNEVNTAKMLKQDDPLSGLRLFRQDKGVFSDITSQAGIVGSGLSYGLGLGITDINQDGWPDFYLSNDYDVPDYLYINNRDGTFSDQLITHMGHSSHFSMGNDIGDINNDGLPDIITLDMLPEDNARQKLLLAPDNYSKFNLNVRKGFHYQYMRNMLQLNNGDGTFSEIGQLAGISNTDWSWSALLADYNNDGWKDVYITNGYYRDYTNLDFINYMDNYVKSKGRLVRQDVLELISNMPASDVVNYMYENKQGLTFSEKTQEWGLAHVSNSNGAAYADLDNDGDLDLIVNNINQPAFIYQNLSQQQADQYYLQVKLIGDGMNTMGTGATVALSINGKKQKLEQYTARGYLSTVSPIMHFGVGQETQIDTLEVYWPTGKMETLTDISVNQVITLYEKDAKQVRKEKEETTPIFAEVSSPLNFTHQALEVNDFDRQTLLISELSYVGPCMEKGDINGDGLEDVVVGGAKGQPTTVFLQEMGKTFSKLRVAAFDQHRESQDVAIALFDANGDGILDIYVASGGYHTFQPTDERLNDRLYLNDGKGDFVYSNTLPNMQVSKGCVAVHDINGDGYSDIFVGGRVIPGRYPETPQSFLLVNDGTGNFTNEIQTLAPALQQSGMITDAVWLDLDQDDKKELILAGEWMSLMVLGWEANQLIDKTLNFFDEKYTGWWNSIAVADINNDKLPDLVVGNVGTNTQFELSSTEPVELYYDDFDDNGSIDPIFCYYIAGNSYPYVTRDELLRQMVSLKAKYTSYESFAHASLSEILTTEQLNNANHLSATHSRTMLFINSPNGKLKASILPIQTQFAPICAITPLDYNQDGNQDLLLCGNNSHFKLRLGKMDANYGVLLKGDGKGGFTYIPQTQSGFSIKGNVRSIVQIDNQLLLGINQGPIITYELRNSYSNLSQL